MRKWLAQRGSTGTGTIDDADREMAKHDHDQHTWLHVLVEQGNNSVLWKVRTIRIYTTQQLHLFLFFKEVVLIRFHGTEIAPSLFWQRRGIQTRKKKPNNLLTLFPKCVLTLYTSADVVDLKRCQEIVSLKVSTS